MTPHRRAVLGVTRVSTSDASTRANRSCARPGPRPGDGPPVLDDREDVAVADEPERAEAGSSSRSSRGRARAPGRCACRSASVPSRRRPEARRAERAARPGRPRSRRSSEASPRAVQRSRSERPEPSTRRTPASGTRASPEQRRDDDRALRGRALRRAARRRVLQQHLGGEVVALPVHESDERSHRRRRRRRRASGAPPGARPTTGLPGDLRSRARASARGSAALRRAPDRGEVRPLPPAPVDDERGERRRLLDVEGRLPAGPGAPARRTRSRRRPRVR